MNRFYRKNTSPNEAIINEFLQRNKNIREIKTGTKKNRDYTAVMFKDGTKSIVWRNKDDRYDLEKAILYALLKKPEAYLSLKFHTPTSTAYRLLGVGYSETTND